MEGSGSRFHAVLREDVTFGGPFSLRLMNFLPGVEMVMEETLNPDHVIAGFNPVHVVQGIRSLTGFAWSKESADPRRDIRASWRGWNSYRDPR
jgi:hypothetical protein